jgi:predicted nucleic acid-binding protein
VITVDTSVVVAAFARWHEDHDAARVAIEAAEAAVAHVLIETYSVLTRLPAPRRAPGELVVDFLTRHFSDDPLTLTGDEHVALLAEVARVRIGGGAVYDAVVGATARARSATLLSLDRRAARTYRVLGVPHEFLGHR